jgi:hypothetical protein
MGGISLAAALLVAAAALTDPYLPIDVRFSRVELLVGGVVVSLWALAGIAQVVAGLSLAKLRHTERRRRLRLSVVATGAGALTALPWALPILGLVLATIGMLSERDYTVLVGIPIALGLLFICALPFALVVANVAALRLAARGGYAEPDAA